MLSCDPAVESAEKREVQQLRPVGVVSWLQKLGGRVLLESARELVKSSNAYACRHRFSLDRAVMPLLLAADRAVEWGTGIVAGMFDVASAFPSVPFGLARRARKWKLGAPRVFLGFPPLAQGRGVPRLGRVHRPQAEPHASRTSPGHMRCAACLGSGAGVLAERRGRRMGTEGVWSQTPPMTHTPRTAPAAEEKHPIHQAEGRAR